MSDKGSMQIDETWDLFPSTGFKLVISQLFFDCFCFFQETKIFREFFQKKTTTTNSDLISNIATTMFVLSFLGRTVCQRSYALVVVAFGQCFAAT